MNKETIISYSLLTVQMKPVSVVDFCNYINYALMVMILCHTVILMIILMCAGCSDIHMLVSISLCCVCLKELPFTYAIVVHIN
jgi:hypothetical protein